MLKTYLRNIIALTVVIISLLALNPLRASAEWRQDDTGWWYADGNSYYIGWKLIDGKWYYFNSDGYMAHDIDINGYTLSSDGSWIQNNISSNTTQNTNSFDINVNLKYNIHLDDKIKETDPNIIKATRQAIFDLDCYFARLNHYNVYSKNNDVLIFDVKQTGTDTWNVSFYEKKSDEIEYNKIGHLTAIVEKQTDGTYVGSISHSSPITSTAETY